MDVILAEKPSVALNIAKALGSTNKHDGYFEGNGYIVTFAFGHLLTLKDTKDYDESMSKWELEKFPFIPEKFQYKIKEDPGIKKQFKIIKELVNKDDVDLIINATDGDREGEIIAFTILKATGTKKPIKRLWISSHTPEDIKKGMNNLIENEKMMPLQEAGLCRQIIDWTIGINFTTTATLKYGNGTLLNIGRVIMPTVKLIYDRDMEIKKFIPKEYYQLIADFKTDNECYSGVYLDKDNNLKFDNVSEIKNISELLQGEQGKLLSKKVTESKKNSPKMFNLSDLQGYITTKYKDWSSDQVLKVAQSLYEKTYISYPRTPSRVLSESQVSEAENTLNKLIDGQPYKNLVTFSRTKNVFDSSKVESHPAITPTYVIPNGLSADEGIIYNEIKLRFISQFMPPCIYENTEYITTVKEYNFISKGKVIKDKGWLFLYSEVSIEDTEEKTDSKEENINQMLPQLDQGDSVTTDKINAITKYTTTPGKYTEQSLLKAMETCNKNITDENIEQVLKGFEIGTQATRAEVIRKIQEVGYVFKKGKSLSIAEVGINLIEIFPVKELMDIDYTGRLEYDLKRIEEGTYTREEFTNQIIEFTKDSIEKIKNTDGDIGLKKEKTALCKCPMCHGNIVENKNGYGCDKWKEGCKFYIGEIAGKKLTESQVKQLILKKETGVIKGFTGKKGKFEAKLKLNEGKIEFSFDNKAGNQKKSN